MMLLRCSVASTFARLRAPGTLVLRTAGRVRGCAASLSPFSCASVAQAAMKKASLGVGSSLRIVPCTPTAAREAPTPIVFASGLVSTASQWEHQLPFFRQAPALGYTVGLLDLPGYGLASSGHNSNTDTLDELLDDVRASLQKLHTAPIIVAPSVTATLFQKYLESFPIAGLIAVSPLPPNILPLVQRHLALQGGPNALPTQAQLASWLRRMAATPERAGQFWLGSSDEVDESELPPSFVETIEALAGSVSDGGNGRLCGFEASADWLFKLCREPVNLEPQPVPMLALFGEKDRFLSAPEDKQATVDFHALETPTPAQANGDTIPCIATQDGITSPRNSRIVAGMEDGSIQAVSFNSMGHDLLGSSDEQLLHAVSTVVQRWVEKRF